LSEAETEKKKGKRENAVSERKWKSRKRKRMREERWNRKKIEDEARR
jgi:hypothetical protein